MLYSWLAALTVAAHGAFILFVTFGALAVARWPRLAWLHVPAVLWGAYVEFAGRICPLTPLENRFRRLAGEAGYPEGYIEHYLLAAIYPHDLTPATQVAIGLLALVINAVGYAWLWRRSRRVTGAGTA